MITERSAWNLSKVVEAAKLPARMQDCTVRGHVEGDSFASGVRLTFVRTEDQSEWWFVIDSRDLEECADDNAVTYLVEERVRAFLLKIGKSK